MKRLCLYLLFFQGISVCYAVDVPNEKTWTMAWLDTLSQYSHEYKEVIRKANYYLTQSPIVVTDKQKCLSGNRHNYESLSTYFWPDSQKKENAPWVYRDGFKNPERLNYDGGKINVFTQSVVILSQAYWLTGREEYARKWNENIQAWFIHRKTRMLPNFSYAQIVMNANQNQGNSYGIIDGYVLIEVVESIWMMRQRRNIPSNVDRKLQRWFSDFSGWLQTSRQGIEQANATNNLSIAYDVMLYVFLSYVGKTQQASEILRQFPVRRLQKQFLKDGTQPIEQRRAKPISYSIYNLEHVLDLCIFARLQGRGDFFHSQVETIALSTITKIEHDMETIPAQPTLETPDLPVLRSTLQRLKNKFRFCSQN